MDDSLDLVKIGKPKSPLEEFESERDEARPKATEDPRFDKAKLVLGELSVELPLEPRCEPVAIALMHEALVGKLFVPGCRAVVGPRKKELVVGKSSSGSKSNVDDQEFGIASLKIEPRSSLKVVAGVPIEVFEEWLSIDDG